MTEERKKELIDTFRSGLRRGDVAGVRELLRGHEAVRGAVNTPLFAFDGRAIAQVKKNLEMVDLLLEYGADINLRSGWWAGGFGILDHTDEETARPLIARGAVVDIWAAAGLNRLDRARELLDGDPALVNARGGDGCRPLHFARSIEMIDLLLERGAEIDARDVDHESTPAQYAMARPWGSGAEGNVPRSLARVRHLVDRGATVDVLMAAALDDAPRLEEMLDHQPELFDFKVGDAGYALCPKAPGGHIYHYILATAMSVAEVAGAFESRACIALLGAGDARQRFLTGCAARDRAMAEAALRETPDLVKSLSARDQGRLATAAWVGDERGVALMLDVGFDPLAAGPDTGTALHCAAWHGRAEIVRLILGHPAVRLRLAEVVEARESTHNGTPIGWCCHGSTNCRNKQGDYPAVARMLLEAGAKANQANRDDASPEVRTALAEFTS